MDKHSEAWDAYCDRTYSGWRSRGFGYKARQFGRIYLAVGGLCYAVTFGIEREWLAMIGCIAIAIGGAAWVTIQQRAWSHGLARYRPIYASELDACPDQDAIIDRAVWA